MPRKKLLFTVLPALNLIGLTHGTSPSASGWKETNKVHIEKCVLKVRALYGRPERKIASRLEAAKLNSSIRLHQGVTAKLFRASGT